MKRRSIFAMPQVHGRTRHRTRRSDPRGRSDSPDRPTPWFHESRKPDQKHDPRSNEGCRQADGGKLGDILLAGLVGDLPNSSEKLGTRRGNAKGRPHLPRRVAGNRSRTVHPEGPVGIGAGIGDSSSREGLQGSPVRCAGGTSRSDGFGRMSIYTRRTA